MKKNRINNDFSENDFQDILEYHPNWIIKWGVTGIAVVILVLIFTSRYIDEPEIIKSRYEFTLKSKLINNPDTVKKDVNDYTCKIFFGILEKDKIKKGKKVILEFQLSKTGSVYTSEGTVDSIKYNPEKEKYESIITITSGLNYDIKSEVINNGILEGNVNVIVDIRSLFDRIFGKYKEINRL